MRPAPAVFVFVMEGCGACEEYLPRFQALAEPYLREGHAVGVYDLARGGKEAAFAEGMKVTATPTTIVMTPRGLLRRTVGAVSDREIAKILKYAFG